jgi:hypothetical protein
MKIIQLCIFAFITARTVKHLALFLGSRRNRDLRTGFPAGHHSNGKYDFTSRRSSVFGVARLQDDPIRLKSYFLKGFSLVLGPCPLRLLALFLRMMLFSFFCVHRRDYSLTNSDDGDFGDNQSLGMADLFARTGSAKLDQTLRV